MSRSKNVEKRSWIAKISRRLKIKKVAAGQCLYLRGELKFSIIFFIFDPRLVTKSPVSNCHYLGPDKQNAIEENGINSLCCKGKIKKLGTSKLLENRRNKRHSKLFWKGKMHAIEKVCLKYTWELGRRERLAGQRAWKTWTLQPKWPLRIKNIKSKNFLLFLSLLYYFMNY